MSLLVSLRDVITGLFVTTLRLGATGCLINYVRFVDTIRQILF